MLASKNSGTCRIITEAEGCLSRNFTRVTGRYGCGRPVMSSLPQDSRNNHKVNQRQTHRNRAALPKATSWSGPSLSLLPARPCGSTQHTRMLSLHLQNHPSKSDFLTSLHTRGTNVERLGHLALVGLGDVTRWFTSMPVAFLSGAQVP